MFVRPDNYFGLNGIEFMEYNPDADILYMTTQWNSHSGYDDWLADTTVVNNPGSGAAKPVFVLTEAEAGGTLYSLINYTTGDELYLNISPLEGEEITIDFEKLTVTSNIGRNLIGDIFPPSDFDSFRLVPGDNLISCFFYPGAGAAPTALLSFTETEIGI